MEDIRKNWEEHKDKISKEQLENIWESYEKKMEITDENIFYNILKKFISGEINYNKPLWDRIHIILENENALLLKGMTGGERKEMHLLCDKIGLHHNSVEHPKAKNKKFLYIYKPEGWCWEYTIKNPYSKSEEFYKNREEKRKERLESKYCGNCDKTGLEVDLYHSVYIRGIYCDDCLDIMSDGEGGVYSDHKFEPII